MIAGMMLFAEWTGSFSHYLIWSGLFALLLAPAVLARTRWSESPPLLICVSLSVVAHLLLTIYAYAIRLPHGDAGPGAGGDMAGEVVIALQLLDDANSVAESAAAAEPQPRSFEANDTASDAMNSSESATGQDIDASPKVESIAESDVTPSAVAASKAAPPSVSPSNTAPPPGTPLQSMGRPAQVHPGVIESSPVAALPSSHGLPGTPGSVGQASTALQMPSPSLSGSGM